MALTYLGKREIENLLVKCPNAGCGAVARHCVNEHTRTSCPHSMIPCKYKGIGCSTKLKRKNMAAHEQDDKLHLHMALDRVNSLDYTVKVTAREEQKVRVSNFCTFKVSEEKGGK